MKVGDAIRTNRVKSYFKGDRVRGDLEFVAPKGKRFVLLYLGMEDVDSYDLDPNEVLEAGGWSPPSVKKLSEKVLKEARR